MITFDLVGDPNGSAPVAVNDSVEVEVDTMTPFDVLANDSDPDGDLSPSTLEAIESPSSGTTLVEGGVVIYQADSSAGNDSFTYQVCDVEGNCASADVNVVIVSGAPPALPACSLIVVDSFQQAPWTFTFQVRNTTSGPLDFEFVIPGANYELTNLVINGSGENVVLDQTKDADGSYNIVVSGTLPAFQSVGGQQPNGFQGALNPTNGEPDTKCPGPGSGDLDPGDDSDGSLPACSSLVVDSFGAGPWFFTFQIRNTTSGALDFEFVIPDANYELTNLVFNGSGQIVELEQTQNSDGTYDITVSGTLPAFQSVGGQQPNGFQGALNPTNGEPAIACGPT